MKKKLVLMILVVMTCLFGCGKEEQTDEEINEQLKAMAEEIVFEEKEMDGPYIWGPCYSMELVNPTETDFADFIFNVNCYDKDGNVESYQCKCDKGASAWKAGDELAFFGTIPSKEHVKCEIVSMSWLRMDSSEYVEVNLE